ncbi:MAG: 4'-phosphopantetheinyl transferase superfamily protein [Bacteroidetes bacterium]|nr:4'-phosphopantetheinyl transferase superfamily protein [Bacteroidota bacterium]
MPLFYQHNINEQTKLAVWHIQETEDFFLRQVPLQREITHPHKRLQHLAGRYLLRLLFPDFPLSMIKIAKTMKPFISGDPYHFSISHCGNFAAAIVSTAERTGIDIEIPSSKVIRVRHKFLHAVEWDAILRTANIPPATDITTNEKLLRQITLMWSAKETVFKWYGSGEVDFSSHIRLHPPPERMIKEGIIDGLFVKSHPLQLQLHYIHFPDICLVWVVTPK